ncbi:type IV toxin-antitoxin system AbiEi family antitoxin domain-containing protein [Thermococcus stetteri]|uniref:type IV toxin-antitoxin system AbiEi family antitoxin domain-containing protein n=1 Tax=Thermococcus stetteri TaxID=49900 RepID=UPI001AEA3AB7|nr:hypothetical protein [Thermococcus stetteri]MBP1911680.1 putative transcriptional regulator of viral defense system [Thermococcus stetteri]
MNIAVRFLLSRYGGKVITKEELKKICGRFGVDVDYLIHHLISYGYVIRILRGVYYVKTVEEFKLKKALRPLEIIGLGLNRLGIKWYYGLFTALKLNALTHEYFAKIFILNDRIYRSKTLKIYGEDVEFIKIKPLLTEFGVIDKGEVKYSDVEKTLLDFLYLSRYNPKLRTTAGNILTEYWDRANKEKIKEYLTYYPVSIRKVLENEGLL